MKDLTKGYPAKVIIMFTIPIMLSYILQQLYNLVDSKIVSEYVGPEALAAIGATAVVSNLIIGFINGLTQGFAIPIANSFGAKDMDRLRKNVAGAILLTLSVAVVMTMLSLYFIEDILIALGTPIEIRQDALDYGLCENYDGIILDIMMPKLDGIGVLEQIRKDTELKKQPHVIDPNVCIRCGQCIHGCKFGAINVE